MTRGSAPLLRTCERTLLPLGLAFKRSRMIEVVASREEEEVDERYRSLPSPASTLADTRALSEEAADGSSLPGGSTTLLSAR